MKVILPSGPFTNIHREFSKKFEVLRELICAELSQPDLNILRRHEFIPTLQSYLSTPEAIAYSPANYYWYTRIDDLLNVYSLHMEILSEDDDEKNPDDNLTAAEELYSFWVNCELAQPFLDKKKTFSLLEASEFVLALFEQNLLGFFHLQISKSPNMIDSLIYPITMEVGDSNKQIYLLSRDQLISFETPSETFPVVVIKDFLPTLNKVSYLDKGKWYSAEVSPSCFINTELGPIKIIHHGQLNSSQYSDAVISINNSLKLIRSADENLFSFVSVFTSYLCITLDSNVATNFENPVPGMSFISLEKTDELSLAVKILQSSALHFLNATLVLNDLIVDDGDFDYFDVEIDAACSIQDILRNQQVSYWALMFLLKLFDTLSYSKGVSGDSEKLLMLAIEFNFKSLLYEDYIEHALQTYKLTQAGKDFCEQFTKCTRDANSKIQTIEVLLQKKFPDDSSKLMQKLENWRAIKKKHSLNH